MKLLARSVSEIIIIEFGKDYFLKRLSNPFWFQAFGCVLGFDWHSSGLTTTVCGALKEAFRDLKDSGIYVCGGKGATSRKTPQEIESIAYNLAKAPQSLIYASKMVAKVDNNALQDTFILYHHTFIFTKQFNWIVIQQGMSDIGKWARRYHWSSENFNSFVEDPHEGIVSDKSFLTLNMVDKGKEKSRDLIGQLSQRKPEDNFNDLISLKKEIQSLPSRHRVLLEDINPKYLHKIFLKTYENKPENFERLLSLANVGGKTLRALALISDLIYGESLSFRDPARFSFAHGGKDGYPYHVNLTEYQRTVDILNKAVNKAKIGCTDKVRALKRLHTFYSTQNTKKIRHKISN